MKHRFAVIWQMVTVDVLCFVFKPPTLLLWSLILMIGSFFLRSHTTALPLGLAEARMCWTCLFQDTTLISSAGWKEEQKSFLLKHDTRQTDSWYFNDNFILCMQCKHCTYLNYVLEQSGDGQWSIYFVRVIRVLVDCLFKHDTHPGITWKKCGTNLCLCPWCHWTAKIIQVPDIYLWVIRSWCEEITLKDERLKNINSTAVQGKKRSYIHWMNCLQGRRSVWLRMFTWKGLKSSALIGPVCLSDCPTTASAPEFIMISGLYTVNIPFSLPPTSLPPVPSAPIPKSTHTILCNLWNMKSANIKCLNIWRCEGDKMSQRLQSVSYSALWGSESNCNYAKILELPYGVTVNVIKTLHSCTNIQE